jgi:type IV pilus assembly protein PilA
MKTIQKGFTLIELMIVVAIIGILAAVAIPAYQDYIARAQVTEAVNLMGGVKTPMAEFFADKGRYPATLGSVVGTTRGKYTDSIAYSGGAAPAAGVGTVTFVATMKAAASSVNAGIAAKSIALQSLDGGKTWNCTVAPSGVTLSAAMIEKFVPGACK